MSETLNSTTAQVLIAITPTVGIAIAGILIFFYILWRHHEIKLRIKTGTYKTSTFDFESFSLLAGLLLTGVGFILTVLFICIEGISYIALGGLIPFVVGICFLIFYKVNPSFKNQNDKFSDK